MFLLQPTEFCRIQSVGGSSIIFRTMLRPWVLIMPLFAPILQLIRLQTVADKPDALIISPQHGILRSGTHQWGKHRELTSS